MKAFKRWLKLALERLDRAKDSLRCHMEAGAVAVEDVWDEAGYLAAELGKLAAKLGLHGIVAEAAELEGYAEPDAVRVLLAKAHALCERQAKKLWYSVPEAAAKLGNDIETVRGWCVSGELRASNGAKLATGKVRWKISQAAIDDFMRAREHHSTPARVKRPKVIRMY